MAILREGGSAVDAVEMAIISLEDHPITNAGFNSNLTIAGTVECDATIVDHLGRSGATGAVERMCIPFIRSFFQTLNLTCSLVNYKLCLQ